MKEPPDIFYIPNTLQRALQMSLPKTFQNVRISQRNSRGLLYIDDLSEIFYTLKTF